jgi:hypothetical protein
MSVINLPTRTSSNANAAADINTLNSNDQFLQGEITPLQGNVTTLQGQVSTLQSNVSTAQGNITTLQGNVTTLQGNVVDINKLLYPRNYIVNPSFKYWMDNTGSTGTTSQYLGTVHRCDIVGVTSTISRQSHPLYPGIPTTSPYFARIANTVVSSVTDICILNIPIENVKTLSGKTATLIFYARASTGTPSISVECVQVFGTGGSPSASVTGDNAVWNGTGIHKIQLSTSWAKYTITGIQVPSVSGKTLGTDGKDALTISFWQSAGSNFNSRTNSLGTQAVTIDYAAIGLYESNTDVGFHERSDSEELALIGRYYQKSYSSDMLPGTGGSVGNYEISFAITTAYFYSGKTRLSTEMRAFPAVANYSPVTGAINTIFNTSSSADLGLTSVNFFNNMSTKGWFNASNTSTLTINHQYVWHWTADARL